ncbi:MAG: (Fe-S)-binding protein, partial [bacterium]
MKLKESERQKVIDSVVAMNKGPRMLKLYMDICAKCGTCASQCHIAQSDPSVHTNPARRADHLRKILKRYGTLSGKVLGSLSPNGKLDIDIDRWAKDFYDCTGCRRCAQFCPFGIDNSIITRKGRAIVHSLGKTPFKVAETQRISDEYGNDEGMSFEAFMENVKFLESEMLEETGVEIKIPVGKEKADVLFVPASADLI